MIQTMRKDQGITLLEVLVSLALIGILVGTVITAMTQLTRKNTESEVNSSAAVAAQRVLDALRVQDPAQLPSSGSSPPQTVTTGGRTFTVTVQYCPNNNLSGYCSGSARHVSARVTQRGREVLNVDTVFTSVNSTAN